VLGYSAVKSGLAFLPFTVGIVTAAALASQLVARIGARPLILAGAILTTGGMFWFSRLTEHATYLANLLGPMLVTSFGLGLLFVPMSLVALHNVAERDAGVAGSLLNTGQQVGGAIGLAALGTIAWTTVADNQRNGVPLAHALATGFARGFLTSAGIALLALVVAIVAIRIRRQDLTGAVEPAPEAALAEPAALQDHQERVALAAATVPCRHC
jgi:MFS family permease